MNGNDKNCITVHPKIGWTESSANEVAGRLDSWKAIAAFFQRSVRTVQRWERLEGMPVYRHSHGAGDSVFAYCTELNAWWAGRSHPGDPRRTTLTMQRAQLGALTHAQMASLRTLLEAILERQHEVSRNLRTEPRATRRFIESKTRHATCDQGADTPDQSSQGNRIQSRPFLPEVR
jgi:hypothetical protein